MQNYETLLLARTEATNDELANIESQFEKMISEGKGKFVIFDKWGKYQLPYPVKKNSYGIYALVRYKLPVEHLADTHSKIDSFIKIKCNDIVLRYVTVKLEQDAAGAYLKPDPLDSSRNTEVNIIKDGKIEQLLDSVDSSATTPTKEEAAPAAKQEAPKAAEEKTEAPSSDSEPTA